MTVYCAIMVDSADNIEMAVYESWDDAVEYLRKTLSLNNKERETLVLKDCIYLGIKDGIDRAQIITRKIQKSS